MLTSLLLVAAVSPEAAYVDALFLPIYYLQRKLGP